MRVNIVFAFLIFLMLSVLAVPVNSWVYQDDTPSDTRFERFGPRADKVLIKLYPNETAEWDALARGEIDITDSSLTKAYYDLFTSNTENPSTGLPYNETINTVFYGSEFWLFLLDLNHFPFEYWYEPGGGPFWPCPVYPNPTSVVGMRQAIAHLVNRSWLDSIVGKGLYVPLYTVVQPSRGAYSHPEIKPGGALENLTYPYSRATAETILDTSGFLVNASTGWRYWDRNKNNKEDSDEYLELKFVIRSDHSPRKEIGTLIADELNTVKIRVNRIYATSSKAKLQVMMNKDFHVYTGGWSLGEDPDPDYLIFWNWDFFWLHGSPLNYAVVNDPILNEASYGVSYASTQEDALREALRFQKRFAEIAAAVPLWDYASSKAVNRFYTGGNMWQPVTPDDGENQYRGQYWEGAVNKAADGVDSGWSFLNMHPRGYERGGNMTIRWGFATTYMRSFNPVYAEYLWDRKTLNQAYESLLIRNPYNLLEFLPQLAESFELDTYQHQVYGSCTKIKFTLRSDATWTDGTPVTVADVFFTFVELDDILASRGLPPPWWIGNVQNILSFSILDPHTFEVLLDIKSIFAVGWVGGNIILPKHVWKPLAESGDIENMTADPNLICCGPWRLKEYAANSQILLTANTAGSTVKTSLIGSVPITSPMGYWRHSPLSLEFKIDGAEMAKIDFDTQPHATSFTVSNNYLGGPVTIDIYQTVTQPNGTLIETVFCDVTLNASDQQGANWTWTYSDVLKGKIRLEVKVHMPAENAWLNSTQLLWSTVLEDIAGSNFYDDLGLSTYPFKSQLLTPDLKVDIKDVAVAAKAFGAYPGHARWSTIADFNKDYKIDIKDIATLAQKFGWTGTP